MILFNANETIKQAQKLRMMMLIPPSGEKIKITPSYRSSSFKEDNLMHPDLFPDPKFVKKKRKTPLRGLTPQNKIQQSLPRQYSHNILNEYAESKDSCRTEPERGELMNIKEQAVKLNAWG